MIISELKDNMKKQKLIVVVIKPTASALSNHDMKTKLTVLFKKSKLMENENNETNHL
jgi:RNase P protein component